MNTLVLGITAEDFHFTVLSRRGTVELQKIVSGYRGAQTESDFFTQALRDICRQLSSPPGAIAVRIPFGGNSFAGPAVYGKETRQKFVRLIPEAPLHLPGHLVLLDSCRAVFTNVPIVTVFETSFFTRLPLREYLYGLPANLSGKLGLRRFGVHGLYHQEAIQAVHAARRQNADKRVHHILSICLEPKPEVAAIVGRRPVMVTGGVSPLEGIPGETSSGELDPGIVLALCQKEGWGPEQVNNVLTRESGLSGLSGREVTLPEILHTRNAAGNLAYKVLRYRMLLACGSGVAAMGALDRIVLSGRYAEDGLALGRWLIGQLPRSVVLAMNSRTPIVLKRNLDSIVAEQAATLIRKLHLNTRASETGRGTPTPIGGRDARKPIER